MLQLRYSESKIEAGCDEAGRGCLAGPVTAAAVILPDDFDCPPLNDSKQLSEKVRDELRPFIMQHALAWAIASVENEEIDELNILRSSFVAMHRALDQLKTRPELILVDGNRFIPYNKIQHQCMVKGDSRFLSIAAASVLAKTERDAIMRKMHEEFPVYGWNRNMGYPTKAHRDGIRKHGACKYHRRSFSLLPTGEQLKLDL